MRDGPREGARSAPSVPTSMTQTVSPNRCPPHLLATQCRDTGRATFRRKHPRVGGTTNGEGEHQLTSLPGQRAALPGAERPWAPSPPLLFVSAQPLSTYRPCLVMIISVWCRWNLSQRGRLQRKTCARSPGPAAGIPSAPSPPQEPDAAG